MRKKGGCLVKEAENFFSTSKPVAFSIVQGVLFIYSCTEALTFLRMDERSNKQWQGYMRFVKDRYWPFSAFLHLNVVQSAIRWKVDIY